MPPVVKRDPAALGVRSTGIGHRLGDKMNQVNQVVNGFLFGIGLILAAAAMRFVFHMQLCGG